MDLFTKIFLTKSLFWHFSKIKIRFKKIPFSNGVLCFREKPMNIKTNILKKFEN